MGSRQAHLVVLDAGGLIALERHDRAVHRLVTVAERVVVPAGVLAQVWRGSSRQVAVGRVLNAEGTYIEALDGDVARTVGVICASTGASDVIDVSVAVAGRRHGALVVTSDADELLRIDPGLHVHRC